MVNIISAPFVLLQNFKISLLMDGLFLGGFFETFDFERLKFGLSTKVYKIVRVTKQRSYFIPFCD